MKLLKVDCEGAEYGILEDAPLDRVDYFAGEFHRNQLLVSSGFDPAVLRDKVEASVGTVLFCGECGMAD